MQIRQHKGTFFGQISSYKAQNYIPQVKLPITSGKVVMSLYSPSTSSCSTDLIGKDTVPNNEEAFYHDTVHNLLICKPCGCVVNPTTLDRHLSENESHQHLIAPERVWRNRHTKRKLFVSFTDLM